MCAVLCYNEARSVTQTLRSEFLLFDPRCDMKEYRLYDVTYFEDFREMIDVAARKTPDAVAFSYKEDPRSDEVSRRTFADVKDTVEKYGTAMLDAGCRDVKCAIIGGTSIGWILTYFALMSVGAVSVPCDKELSAEDLSGIIRRAGCRFVFYGSDIAEKITALKETEEGVTWICMNGEPKEGDATRDDLIRRGEELLASGDDAFARCVIDRDEVASIVFTSGTTGKGKGVMLSQRNIASDVVQAMYLFRVTMKTLCVLPLHHTYASTINIVGHFAQGVEIYLSSGLRYFLKELKDQQPTHLVLVPLFVKTIYKKIWATAEKNGKAKLLRRMMKISNGMRRVGLDVRRVAFKSIIDTLGGKVEFIICGGAALGQDIIDTFDALGITILNGYGITECSPLISCNRNRRQKSGSVGIPIIGEDVVIDSPDENGEGEICVKGPNVMLGYYNDPEATAAVFDERGYFHTGDYGRLDGDGWVYVTGRIKNMIIFSNGKNVYPEEIEDKISAVKGVSVVVVYAGTSRRDPEREIIVAEIFPDEEELKTLGVDDPKEYFKHEVAKINRTMVSFKQVGHVKIRSTEFNKNSSKKITRFTIDKTID